MIKLPPREKIYEAYSAIADKRIIIGDREAKVTSSNKEKEYTVAWQGKTYSSNDNASYWQGYAGYPMIAVLMLQGKLSLNMEVTEYFKGINWTELNSKYKRKYDKAAAEVFSILKAKGADCRLITAEADRVYKELHEIDINTVRSKLRPPKSKNKE